MTMLLDGSSSVDRVSAPAPAGAHDNRPAGFVASRVLKQLGQISPGRIAVRDAVGNVLISATEPLVTVTVLSPRFYSRAAWGGSLGAAESYLEGDWDCDDLLALFRLLAQDLAVTSGLDGWITTAARTLARCAHWLSANTRRGSRRNIEAHYDLGNNFFELFLDPTMMYSSAIFPTPETTLEQAQLARLDRVCRLLDLYPNDHLLEIGTGWGGLACYAARQYGCRITTTTISREQFEYATRRVQQAGLTDRVTVLNQDYRNLTGQFDKLVSIEMIEAVGHQFYETYFRQCGRLLRPRGRLLLQAIVMPEQRYEQYLKSVDFIQKYIFPGGCLPSLTAMQTALTRTTNLRLLQLDDFAADYARTLAAWRNRFLRRLPDVRELGFPERFIRMWDYYFCYCQAAFEARAVGVVHALWGR